MQEAAGTPRVGEKEDRGWRSPVHGVLGPSLLRRNTRQLVWALERGTRRLVLRVLESSLDSIATS